jgi:hypothetical protein
VPDTGLSGYWAQPSHGEKEMQNGHHLNSAGLAQKCEEVLREPMGGDHGNKSIHPA